MRVDTGDAWVYRVIWGHIGSYIELNENRRKERIVMHNFIWGLPKVRGTFLGIHIIRAIVFGGVYIGVPLFWDTTIYRTCTVALPPCPPILIRNCCYSVHSNLHCTLGQATRAIVQCDWADVKELE